MGHEFSGTILELGSDVSSSSFHVGQKVAIQPSIYCTTCGACKNGVENACSNGGFIGLSGGGGGLSDEVVVPVEAVLPLPENVDLDIGGTSHFPLWPTCFTRLPFFRSVVEIVSNRCFFLVSNSAGRTPLGSLARRRRIPIIGTSGWPNQHLSPRSRGWSHRSRSRSSLTRSRHKEDNNVRSIVDPPVLRSGVRRPPCY